MTDKHTIAHIEIVDTLTSETIISQACKGQPFNSFLWMEGNYACDCNRFIFYMQIKDPHLTDEDEDADDYPCNHGTPRFRVRIFATDNTLLFDDTKDADNPYQITC